MIRRLHIQNFRCLRDFVLPFDGLSSCLLIGKNGSGKSTVGHALRILQMAARGTNRLGELLKPEDFTRGQEPEPISFELDVEIEGELYSFHLALELPAGFKEFRVLSESLFHDGVEVYSRDVAQMHVPAGVKNKEVSFLIDWHLIALPIVQTANNVALAKLKNWLGKMLILRPVPREITGDSTEESLQPAESVSDLGNWFSGLVAESPSIYSKIDSYLRQVMPDFQDVSNPQVGIETRSLSLQFGQKDKNIRLRFRELSDGEKCFMICALVIAACEAGHSPFCYWDEPDNFLALSEIGHFILALRSTFKRGRGQFVATSHNPETVRRFSDENTFLLWRENHSLQPQIRLLSTLDHRGDLIESLIRDDLSAWA